MVLLFLSSKILSMEYNLHDLVKSSDIKNLKLYLPSIIIDIDNKNKDGNTALHIAAEKNSMKMCKLLVKYGASKDIKNRDNKIPAELATDPKLKKFLSPKEYIFDEYEDEWFLKHPIITLGTIAVFIVYLAWLSRNA